MGIKKNFLYSSILTASNYLFPFIIYPYILRTLGVDNIGICDFVDSIINYFALFSMLGISIVGVREIARANGNAEQLNRSFSSLFILNCITTIIATSILIGAIFTIPALLPYKSLLFIGIIKLFGNFLLIEWLYKGIENFKYITIRTIAVKITFIIAVFILVKNSDDYAIYYFCYAMMYALNAIINCYKASSLVKLNFRNLQFSSIAKPFLIMGLYLILTSMYTTFNIAYLGFATDTTQVGYYTTATKMFTLLLAIYTAFTTVMLPRMSALLAQEKIDEFKQLIHKSFLALLAVSLPIMIIAIIFAPDFIHIMAGDGYDGAIIPARIVMPLVFIIGYEQILVIQILMPLRKDNAILTNSFIGAIVGISMNLLLVGHLQCEGSAYAWVVSEVAVLIGAQYFVNKYIGISFPYKEFVRNILYYLPCLILLIPLTFAVETSSIVRISIATMILFAYTIIIQLRFLKNEIVLQSFHRCISIIKKR